MFRANPKLSFLKIYVTTELYFCFDNNFSKMSVVLNIYEHIKFVHKKGFLFYTL